MIRLYPPEDGPWTHWASFYQYCCDKLKIKTDGRENANTLFRSFEIFLVDFGGRIIFPREDSWSIVCLEFNTEEDLVVFKLTFN